MSRSPRRRADILVPTHLLGARDPGQAAAFGMPHIRARVISGPGTPCPHPAPLGLLPSRWTRSRRTLLGGLFLAERPVIQPSLAGQVVCVLRLGWAAGRAAGSAESRMRGLPEKGIPLGCWRSRLLTRGGGAGRMLPPHDGEGRGVHGARREASRLAPPCSDPLPSLLAGITVLSVAWSEQRPVVEGRPWGSTVWARTRALHCQATSLL